MNIGKYIVTSALIMLSHNDSGVRALIIGDPLYIKHMVLKYPPSTKKYHN